MTSYILWLQKVHFYHTIKAISLKTSNLWFQKFWNKPVFSECTLNWLQHFFSSYGYLFEMILHVKDVSWGYDIYRLTFDDKSLRVLCVHIWNQVLKTLTTELSFKAFKRSLSDLLEPKCKCKITSYLNNYSYKTTTL